MLLGAGASVLPKMASSSLRWPPKCRPGASDGLQIAKLCKCLQNYAKFSTPMLKSTQLCKFMLNPAFKKIVISLQGSANSSFSLFSGRGSLRDSKIAESVAQGTQQKDEKRSKAPRELSERTPESFQEPPKCRPGPSDGLQIVELC